MILNKTHMTRIESTVLRHAYKYSKVYFEIELTSNLNINIEVTTEKGATGKISKLQATRLLGELPAACVHFHVHAFGVNQNPNIEDKWLSHFMRYKEGVKRLIAEIKAMKRQQGQAWIFYHDYPLKHLGVDFQPSFCSRPKYKEAL